MEIVTIEKKTFEEMKEKFNLYSQINHKMYYRLEDVEAFLAVLSEEPFNTQKDGSDNERE